MYKEFTNLYPVSKTLRFELKPTETTLRHIIENNDIRVDKDRHEAFMLAKRMLNCVHQQYISESLRFLELDTNELRNYIRQVTAKEPNARDIKASLQPIFARFRAGFTAANDTWQARYGYSKPFITTSTTQLQLIGAFKAQIAAKLEIDESAIDDVLTKFSKFATYFEGYRLNRMNIYSTEGKATEVANRTIAQNLLTFHRNMLAYTRSYESEDRLLGLPAGSSALFELESYGQFVTQEGIDDYNARIGDLNSAINQARQAHTKDKAAKAKLPFFQTLYKQILGDGTTTELFERLHSAAEYEALITKLQVALPSYIVALREHYQAFVVNPAEPAGIFINKKAVNTLLAKHIDGDYRFSVRQNMPEYFVNKSRGTDEESAANNFISLSDFFAALNTTQAAQEGDNTILKDKSAASGIAAERVWESFCTDLSTLLDNATTNIRTFQAVTEPSSKSGREIIKLALDSYNDVYRMYTYFELRYRDQQVTTLQTSSEFYELFQDSGESADLFDSERNLRFSHSYDLVHNWLTKKPYSLDKWKLNFDCAQLLSGWDVNKETEKHGVILFNEDDYYLAVLTNQGKNVLERAKNPALFSADSSNWHKMEYKLLPGPNKMLPKVLFSKKYRSEHDIPADVDALYKAGTFKKGDSFSLTSLHRLIDFYKAAIPTYPGWAMYEFAFRPTDEYQSIDEFYHEVELGGYKLDRVPINYAALTQLEQSGLIYVFRIANKDLMGSNRKTANLHTSYFQQAFIAGSSVKLNGEAEVFFRPRSFAKPTGVNITPREQTLHRRFTQDKFFFHVPLTLNYQTKTISNVAFNQHVIERIKSLGVQAVVAIDRGEKELGYISVCDIDSAMLEEPISLNTIWSKGGAVKYAELLATREAKRKENRQNWEAVEEMKALKDGYVSHCVKLITDLAIKYNAIIVLENLNVGFKQGRSRIERSVYNQLEQALLKKLQYVVIKGTPASEPFSTERAVQLTPPDISPKATGNHMGWVLFVDPSYTSAIDPVSGYRQQLYLGDELKVSNIRQFISGAFEHISFQNNLLTFRFNWRTLATALNKLKKPGARTQKDSAIQDKLWTIHADVPRAVYLRDKDGQSVTDIVNPQTELLSLFEKYSIAINGDIRQNIANATIDADFVKRFVRSFNQINRLRNTIEHADTIISPVITSAHPRGFDSRTDTVGGYAWNGDANGAYNIARKGTILLKKLYAAESIKDYKAVVKREEYDNLVSDTK